MWCTRIHLPALCILITKPRFNTIVFILSSATKSQKALNLIILTGKILKAASTYYSYVPHVEQRLLNWKNNKPKKAPPLPKTLLLFFENYRLVIVDHNWHYQHQQTFILFLNIWRQYTRTCRSAQLQTNLFGIYIVQHL